MQDKVGIVRREDEMREALAGLSALWERALGSAWMEIASSILAGTPPSTCQICSPFGGGDQVRH